MALSGIFYGTTSNQYIKPAIRWSAVQSEEGNYSDVTAAIYYSRTNTYAQGTEGQWSGSITIDGVTRTGRKDVRITYNSDTLALENTIRVYHDDYGQKRITISAEGHIYGTSLSATTISQTVDLDTILRASTLGATPTNIEEATVITVRKKSEECTHSIEYRFGQLQGFVGEDWQPASQEVRLTDTQISFTIPEAFYYEIPDAPSGICTLTCRTYRDGVLLGQPQRAEFTVTAQKEKCAPLLLAAVEDCNTRTLELTGDKDVLVRGFSTALCKAEVTAQKGATLKKLWINEIPVEGDSLTIPNTETGEYLFRVADSRGYGQECRVTKELIGYIRLTCNLSVKRTDPTSGKGRLTAKGYYYGGSFGATDNGLRLQYRVDGGQWIPLVPVLGEDNYTADAVIDGLVYTRSNTVELMASDALCSPVACQSVQKGVPVFDWGENDFAFHVPVKFFGGVRELYPVGSIYLSVTESDPAQLFGGCWERLKDVFLLAGGDTYPAGSAGGEAEHILTVDEMPEHSHGVSAFVETVAGAGAFDYFRNNASDHPAATQETGGGQPHNNMPPYLAVYAWKRIA